MNVQFYLRDFFTSEDKAKTASKEEKEKERPIIMYMSDHALYIPSSAKRRITRAKFSTGEKIAPKYWNFNKQAVKPLNPFADSINENLRTMAEKAITALREYKFQGISPTPEQIRAKLQLKPSIPTYSTNYFFEVLDKYITAIKVYNPTTKKAASDRTIQKWNTLKVFLKKFQEVKKYQLTFDGINSDFVGLYNNYLAVDCNYSPNTVDKYVSDLKTFLRWSYEEEFHTNIKYQKLASTREEVFKVYLSLDDVRQLYAYEPETDSLLRVKHRFFVQLLTGQRVSDINSFRRESVVNKIWTVYQQKGDKTLPTYVPLHDYVLEILKFYENEELALPQLSEQKYNEYLKTLCRKAGLIRPIVLKNKPEPVPFSDLISSHTGRKSLINILGKLGVEESLIKKISGHSLNNEAYHASYRDFSHKELLQAINKIKLS